MLDDEQAVCFGGNGNSKSDFNDLFFNHDGYYEGQVINIYNRILFRDPSHQKVTSSLLFLRLIRIIRNCKSAF